MVFKVFGTHITDFIAIIGARYGVPLFFLISGFCIHLSQLKQNQYSDSDKFDFGKYFIRRFWRIYPAYVIILFFSCSVSAISGEKIELADFLAHLFLLQGFISPYFNSINLVLWTISIEAALYFLYPVWYLLRKKFGANNAFMISVFVSATSCLLLMNISSNNLAAEYFVLNIWAGWCFGAWLCEKIMIEETDFVKGKLLWMSGICLTIIFYFLNSRGMAPLVSYDISIVLWAWIIVPILSLTIFFKAVKNNLFNGFVKLLSIVGISSYSLYMIHEPMFYLRNEIMNSLRLVGTMRLFFGAFWLLFTFFVAFLSYKLFEKPFIKFRSKIG